MNHVLFERNTKGRDFVVGDIHGCYDQLIAEMDRFHFNQYDRLFSVGDLCDRGPHSYKVAMLFKNDSRLHAIRGNHEQMLINACEPGSEDYPVRMFIQNGGMWINQLLYSEISDTAEFFKSLPIAMTVETSYGRVGIVHGQPYGLDWNKFLKYLDGGYGATIDHVRGVAQWGRAIANRKARLPYNQPFIANVARVYCGHTPMGEVTDDGNITFIDTGAVFGGKLTMLQISP